MLSFPQDVLIVLHWTDCMTIGDNKKEVYDRPTNTSVADTSSHWDGRTHGQSWPSRKTFLFRT
jgi:hypothetical protein